MVGDGGTPLEVDLDKVCTLQPEAFLTPSPHNSEAARGALKRLYDTFAHAPALTAASAAAGGPGARAAHPGRTAAPGAVGGVGGGVPLPELYVRGFDSEQIWRQLEHRMGSELAALKGKVRAWERIGERGEAALDKAFVAPPAESQLGRGDAPPSRRGLAGLEGRGGARGKGGKGGEEDDERGSEGEEEEGEEGEDGEEEGEEEGLLNGGMLGGGEEDEEDEEGGGFGDLLYGPGALSDENEEDSEGVEEGEGDEGTGAGMNGSMDGEEGEGGEEGGPKKKASKGSKKGAKKGAKDPSEIRYEDFFGEEAPPVFKARDLLGSDEDEDDFLEEGLEEEDAEEFGGLGQGGGRGKGRGRDPLGEGEDGEGEEEDEEREEDGEEGEEDGDGEDEEGEGEEEEGEEEGGAGRELALSVGAEKGEGGARTEFERQQERMAKRLQRLEKANLDTKPWMLAGEVTAGARPKNSALEVDLDFEHAARPAPVITEEVTQSLEDMIKARVRERRFDDVERKAPRTAPLVTRDSGTPLDDNPSAQGLAEMYERQYLESSTAGAAPASAKDAAAEAIKKEASEVFAALCGKLDALAHSHFAPKLLLQEDAAPSANVPAVAVEDVAPAAASFASMLAPEEVYRGGQGQAGESVGLGGVRGSAAGMVRSEKELESEDRKRLRSKLKRKWKAEKKASEGAGSGPPLQSPGLGKSLKKAQKEQQQQQQASGEGGKTFTSFTNSARYFDMLQQGGLQKAKDVKKTMSASKVKL